MSWLVSREVEMPPIHWSSIAATLLTACSVSATRAADADLILHHGKIITVDRKFSIHQALAVKGGRILAVGSDADILRQRAPQTEVIDLAGKVVLPGLIDSHVHPGAASMTEFDHAIPEMTSIADVLAYVRGRAQVLAPGEWIEVHQVFLTRLREQRYPTREELDQAAPRHPVLFATGPDASLNSLALKLSGIDRNFEVRDGGAGHAEKDPRTGEPTGILRGCTRYVKRQPAGRQPTELDRLDRLVQLLRDYTSVGLTAIADRDASAAEVDRYRRLRAQHRLPLRVAISHSLDTSGAVAEVLKRVEKIAQDPLVRGDAQLRIVGCKTYLDGGMLTGSAYMRQAWGVSPLYGIADPNYRGLLLIPKDRLEPMIRATTQAGLQFTAHSVGDGAVHTLLDAYESLSSQIALRPTRPCITHSNFMSQEAIARAARLGVVVDLQPIWLFLDGRTLRAQFGDDRLRYFQPLRSLFQAGFVAGGGSDHMQKIGARRAINPYDPFLGMWITLTRQARWTDRPIHVEEALSREQALRFYTTNNAVLLFQEDQIGSLEPGKRADFIVIDRDLLTCPVDDIRDTHCLRTYIDGRLVFERK